MEAEMPNERSGTGVSVGGQAKRAGESPWLFHRSQAPSQAGGRLGSPHKRGEGGGARGTGQGPSARLREPTYQDWDGGSLRVPPTRAGRGRPRARLAPPPSPVDSNKGVPARGRVRAARRGAQGEPEGRAPSPGAHGPGRRCPGSARLPGVAGVPIEVVTEAGAPLQRGAEQRGPQDSLQQGQQPHRPPRSGLVWFGPARPTSLRPRERYKVEGGGGGVRGLTGHAPG